MNGKYLLRVSLLSISAWNASFVFANPFLGIFLKSGKKVECANLYPKKAQRESKDEKRCRKVP